MVSGLIETDEGKRTFSWDKMAIDCLTGSTKLGDMMRDRQLCVVACLLEQGHDLMTSPKSNLSRMPGFEADGLIPFGWKGQSVNAKHDCVSTSGSKHDHMSGGTAAF
jgi:hypothetical protein